MTIKTRKIPKLRFPEFNGDWKGESLGIVLNYEQPTKYIVDSTDYDDKHNTPVLTAGKSFVLGYTKETRDIYKNTPVIIFDDFTTANHYVDFAFKVKSSAMKILKLKNSNNNLKFVYEAMQRIQFLVRGHKRHWIAEFSGFNINIPKKPEQTKIANFLTSVDTKIEQLTKKKELLGDYKKGLMQKIFNQTIRFKADDGSDFSNWEEDRLEDVLSSISTNSYQIKTSDILDKGSYKVVDQGKKEIAGYTNQKDKLLINNGVIVYGDHTTIVKFVDHDFVVGADGVKLLSTNSNNIKYFYFNLLFNNTEPEGYKRHFNIVKKIVLQIPESKEKTKIVNFLTSVDTKIEQIGKQLENTNQYKKALLQQMFV